MVLRRSIEQLDPGLTIIDGDREQTVASARIDITTGSQQTLRLEGDGFELVWGFSCQAVVLGCADSFLFGAGKAVFRPVACDQVPGARGGGQGTETLAKLVFRSAPGLRRGRL